jgi:hypothetical protein
MAIKINHRWKYDYLAITGRVETIYISWISQFSINNTKTTTDTEGNIVNISDLVFHIQKEGLIHPGTIEVSRKTKRARLIAGNHRIQAFDEIGIISFPIYVVIVDEFNDSYGEGVECAENLLNIVDDTVGDVVSCPSNVFKDLHERKKAGLF